MKVQAIISKDISSFNDVLKQKTGSTKDFITLQVLLTDSNAINNNKDVDSELYILWHTKQNAIRSRTVTTRKISVTEAVTNKVSEVFAFDIEINDNEAGYLVISDPLTKVFKDREMYRSSRLDNVTFKDYIVQKKKADPTFTAKGVNCSTSRYPC
jgi:hypothetical protein